jgi:hypothetical protein
MKVGSGGAGADSSSTADGTTGRGGSSSSFGGCHVCAAFTARSEASRPAALDGRLLGLISSSAAVGGATATATASTDALGAVLTGLAIRGEATRGAGAEDRADGSADIGLRR